MKTVTQKISAGLHVHNSIIYNSQDIEATQVSIDGWMDKEIVYIHTMEWYSVMKKTNSTICNNMNKPWRHYAKWNKSDREKTNTVWSHSHVESKKQTKAEIMDTENRSMVIRGRRCGEGGTGGSKVQIYSCKM